MPRPLRQPLLAVAALILLNPLTAPAQDCSEFDAHYRLAGDLAIADARAVAAGDGTAYVAAGDEGVVVVDIGNPEAPAIVNSIYYPLGAVDVWCSPSHLLTLDGNNDLRNYALPLPSPPPTPPSFTAMFAVVDATVVSDVAFIGTAPGTGGSDGLAIFRLADGYAPQLLATRGTSQPVMAVAAAGDHAYVLTQNFGEPGHLLVYQADDPALPQLVADVALTGDFYEPEYLDLAVLDGVAYVSEFWNQLEAYDVSNPTDPQPVDPPAMPPTGWHWLLADGDHLHAISPGGPPTTLHAIDPARDLAPTVGTTQFDGDVVGCAVADGTVVLAAGEDGIALVRFDLANMPDLAGWLPTAGSVNGLAVRSDYAYAVVAGSTFQIFDVSTPTSPALAGSMSLPGYGGYTIALDGRHAFVATSSNGLVAIDVQDPQAPALAGFITLPASLRGFGVRSSYMYVLTSDQTLTTIDVSNPASMQIVGTVSFHLATKRLAMAGDLVLVAADWLLWVLDTSNPAAPVVVGETDLPYFTILEGLAAAADRAYALSRDGHVTYFQSMHTIDFSDPTNPVRLSGGGSIAELSEMVASDDHVYASSASNGLVVCEAPPGSAAGFFASVSLPWSLAHLAIAFDEYLYLGTGDGLAVLGRQCGDLTAVADPAPPPIPMDAPLTAWPNPCNPRTTIGFELDRTQSVTLTIHDLTGRRIATLLDGVRAAGDHAVPWHGRDDHGRDAAAGAYLVRLATDGGIRSGRLMLVR